MRENMITVFLLLWIVTPAVWGAFEDDWDYAIILGSLTLLGVIIFIARKLKKKLD